MQEDYIHAYLSILEFQYSRVTDPPDDVELGEDFVIPRIGTLFRIPKGIRNKLIENYMAIDCGYFERYSFDYILVDKQVTNNFNVTLAEDLSCLRYKKIYSSNKFELYKAIREN